MPLPRIFTQTGLQASGLAALCLSPSNRAPKSPYTFSRCKALAMVHHCARGNIPPSSTDQDLAHRLVMQPIAPGSHHFMLSQKHAGISGRRRFQRPRAARGRTYLGIRRRTPRVSRESVPIVAVSSSDRCAKAAGLEGTHCRDSRWVCTLGFVFFGRGAPEDRGLGHAEGDLNGEPDVVVVGHAFCKRQPTWRMPDEQRLLQPQ